MEDFLSLRKQAKYLDEKMELLEKKVDNLSIIIKPEPEHIRIAEDILEKAIGENAEMLASIEEEKEKGQHNMKQMEMFVNAVNADTERILSQLQDMEQQLVHYGYVPMSVPQEEPKKEEKPVNEIVTVCEEKLEGTYIIDQVEETVPPSKFSKYYYLAVGLPIPPELTSNEAVH